MAANKPEIVLVHGAWHLPHHLDSLAIPLRSLGYTVHSVRLPSVLTDSTPPSFQDHQPDADAIRSVLKPLVDAKSKIVVFCHSYGGVPTSEALKDLITTKDSDKGGVIHVVACNAFVLQSGESLAETVQRPGPTDQWFDVDEKGVATVHADKGARNFYQPGVDDKSAQDAFSTVRPQAAATFVSPQVYSAWKDVPLTYISSSEDAAVPPKVQEMMLEQIPGADVIKVGGGHSPFMSMPDFVAGVVQKVA